MAKIWLALLMVATLGSVDLATSAATFDEVKAAWTAFKADTAIATDRDDCDQNQCTIESGEVDTAAAGTDLDALCEKVKAYLDCTKQKCISLDTQTLDNLCHTVDEVKAAWTAFKGDTTIGTARDDCDQNQCTTESGEVDTAAVGTDLDALCGKLKTYLDCAGQKCTSLSTTTLDNMCYTVTPAPPVTQQPPVTPAPPVTKQPSVTPAPAVTSPTTVDPVVLFQQTLDVIKLGCTDQQCDSTAVANASLSIDERCEKSDLYIDCVTTNCTPVTDTQKTALKAPCKDSGCGILQVSILALMLSLLLSII